MAVAVHRPKLLLEVDLTVAPMEAEPEDLLGKLRARHRPRLRTLLRALHEAGTDNRVAGVVVKVGGSQLDWASMQEIRAALVVFAAGGKPTVAWAESLGEGNGSVDYVLATGCREIWLQPTGELGLLGVAAETTFLRGALDKLGVVPQLDKRHEYKSAADRIMNTEFTPAHREALDAVVGSTWDGAVTAVAQARGLDPDRVRALADSAPLPAQAALAAKLIDRLGYRDEVYAALRERVGDTQLRYADQWTPRPSAAALVRARRPALALVEGRGEIAPGRSRTGPRGQVMGSDSMAAAFRAARADDRVHAVVFRVDSPGGSAVASDTIWREVALTRQAGKPVVVSMGTLAGSGGYYVACGADAILAQPATVTGSIGVLGGKVVVTELMQRLGLGTGSVGRGASSRMFSLREGFTEDERVKLGRLLDRVYEDFVAKVAEGRQLSVEAVDSVARGRIWSGADAAANGLVDVLGGVRDAADVAREKAGLASNAVLRPAVSLPPLARLGRARSSEDPRAARSATSGPADGVLRELAGVWAGDWAGDWARMAAILTAPGVGPLRMPEVRLR